MLYKKRCTVIFAGLIFLACGNRSSLNPPTSNEDNPNCPYQVTRHQQNSWLLTEPEIHFDFWGSYWQNPIPGSWTPDDFQSEWSMLIEQNGVLVRLAEYGIHSGMLDATYYQNDGASYEVDAGDLGPDVGAKIIDDTIIATAINNEIQLGFIPYPNDNTLYIIMLPPIVSTRTIATNKWGGYHAHTNYGSQQYAYTIITYSDDDTNLTISHEIAEAASNPGGFGWYDSASGSEISDLCGPAAITIDGYRIQKVWSQILCQCQ